MSYFGNLKMKAKSRLSPIIIQLWIKRNFIIGVTLLTLLFTVLYLSFQPFKYMASSAILLIPGVNLTETKEAGEFLNSSTKKELINYIKSRNFLFPLIKKQKLADRVQFNLDLNPRKTIYEKIKEKIIFRMYPDEAGKKLEEKIYEQIIKNLHIEISSGNNRPVDVITYDNSVERNNSLIMVTSYLSTTPKMSVQIANAVMFEIINNKKTSAYLVGYDKKLKRADIPELWTQPDIKGAILFFSWFGLVIGICLAYLVAYIQRKKGSSYNVR